jgi:5-amino-6-(5-phospho-D-ribitylamino)uracil phosphatase
VLFAFDLDKTLVTNDYQLPDAVGAAVRGLRDRGHLVTVLTGRPLASARRFLDALEVAGPFSVNHGAQIMGAGGRELRRTRLRSADVRLIVDPWHEHPQVEYSCIIDDHIHVKDPTDARWGWAHTESRVVTRFLPSFDLDADKVVFAASTSAAISAYVAESVPHVERYLWGDGFLEIIGPGADKGSALAFIAAHLGVARADVVAFGDGLNDVSMLRWAGHAVAVGPEAHADVLALAHEHVPSPEAGGVADWIERNVTDALVASR